MSAAVQLSRLPEALAEAMVLERGGGTSSWRMGTTGHQAVPGSAPPALPVLQAVLDAFAAAIWVVDDQCQVHFMNRAAQDCLAHHEGLSLCNQRLCLDGSLQAGRLQRAVHSACAAPGAQDAFQLAEPAHLAPLQVAVSHLDDQSSPHADADPRALVLATRIGPTEPDHTTLRLLFGLSQAEADVLGGLLAGRTLEQCARLRGVALSTVRTQLASIFAKTGTSCQAQLIAAARALPARTAGLRH